MPDKPLSKEEIEAIEALARGDNDPLGGLLPVTKGKVPPIPTQPQVQEYIDKSINAGMKGKEAAPAETPPPPKQPAPPPAPPAGPAAPIQPPEAAPTPKTPQESQVLSPKPPTPALTPRKDPGGDAQAVVAPKPLPPIPQKSVDASGLSREELEANYQETLKLQERLKRGEITQEEYDRINREREMAVIRRLKAEGKPYASGVLPEEAKTQTPQPPPSAEGQPPDPQQQKLYPDNDLDTFLEQKSQESGLRYNKAPPVQQKAAPAPDQSAAQALPEKEDRKSFAPNWYESLPPPDDTLQRALGAGFGGLMKAIMAAHGDGRKKRKGQAESNFLTTLIGEGVMPAVDVGLSSDRQVYDDRMKAAQVQMNMEKMANSGRQENPWEGLRYQLSADKFAEAQRIQAAKEARAERLKDPYSTDSRELQEELIKLRPNLTPEQIAQIRQTPGAMIEQFRPQLGNQASQERGQNYAVKNMQSRHNFQAAMTEAQNREWNRRQGIEQEQVLAKEERQRIASIEEASIPTLELINNRRPPDIGTVNKARELLGARDAITDSALRLAELQNQVDNVLVQGIGSWNAVFGNESQAEVLAEMQSLQQDMAAAQRVMKDQGVPQVYELIENLKTNPAADSWKTFFTGKSAWKALAKTVGRRANHRLKAYNYKDEGSATPTVGGGGAQAPAAKKTFKVSIFEPDTKTWSDPKTISEQRLQKARAKAKAAGFDPDAIIKVVQE